MIAKMDLSTTIILKIVFLEFFETFLILLNITTTFL